MRVRRRFNRHHCHYSSGEFQLTLKNDKIKNYPKNNLLIYTPLQKIRVMVLCHGFVIYVHTS